MIHPQWNQECNSQSHTRARLSTDASLTNRNLKLAVRLILSRFRRDRNIYERRVVLYRRNRRWRPDAYSSECLRLSYFPISRQSRLPLHFSFFFDFNFFLSLHLPRSPSPTILTTKSPNSFVYLPFSTYEYGDIQRIFQRVYAIEYIY